MSSPCDICLEETCNGKHDCQCETCTVKDECYRFLNATVRITNRCTQSCEHCCFESSPNSDIMMTVDMARDIATFIEKNDVRTLNLMGGEFFCNPDWYEIYCTIIPKAKVARIVTNGDWAGNLKVENQISSLVSLLGDKIYFCVSKDRWHTNKRVDQAVAFLESTGAKVRVATEDQTTDASIVPVGRAHLSYISSFYNMMACYCHNPENMYSFLIDEKGNVFKCPFGVLCYAHISDYLDGGFRAKFKELNTKFYSHFLPSCRTCYSAFITQKRGSVVAY